MKQSGARVSQCSSMVEREEARGVHVDKEFWWFKCFCCKIVREEEIHQGGLKCTHCHVIWYRRATRSKAAGDWENRLAMCM